MNSARPAIGTVIQLLLFVIVHLTLVLSVNYGANLPRISKCPTPSCITRHPSSSAFEDASDLTRRKRDILKEITSASSKKVESASTKKLAASFSQGYIDLGSRDPREEGAATLAFVFDTTGSMYDDLKQVIEGAGKILRTVLEKFERPIHDYILVPFNDPDIGELTVTSDPEEFKNSLHELQYFIQGGGDCPEMAVGAIKMALEACLSSSYIYVFTDARAKDYYLLDEVLRLIQKKHTQVVFVMTGDCGNRTHPGYQAFETIASTSSGQVFHLNKSDVDEVLNFVRLSLESRKVNLLSVDRQIDQPGEENLELLVDKTLREFTISVSGEKPKIEIYRPEGVGEFSREDRVDNLLSLANVKIVGVKEPRPGRYNISVGSESKYTVRATGLSSIDFKTGFSLNPTTNFKETYHRPMKGAKSEVLVKPIDETEFGDLYRLQLISLDGEPLVDTPLTRLPGQETLFRGRVIEAPDQPFNVKIFGRDREGYEFERISPTAVSAQLPFPPEVAAKASEIGFYDRPANLTCHIQTLVPFNLTWNKDGRAIVGQRQYPQSAEVTYIIDRPTSADEGIYTCHATNIAGSSIGNIFLDIKEPPPDIVARGNVSLTPGKSGTVSCDVTSTVNFNVSWARYVVKGQVQDFFGKLETVGKFVPIEDTGMPYQKLRNNSLFIEEVTPEYNGWYRCTASNEGGQTSKEIFLEVQALPELTVYPQTTTYTEGKNLTLKCNARGVPAPTVYWRKEDRYITDEDPRMSVDDTHTLRIQDARIEDEGLYTCTAENPAGRGTITIDVEGSVSLVYLEAPRIMAVEKNVLVQSGDTATLQCDAQGTPSPTVRWFKSDSTEVVQMSFIEIDGGNLKISGVQDSDGGTYTCVATNGAGSAEDHVTLRIGSAPTILQAPADQTIEIGGTGGLSCYGGGVPQPTIKWKKLDDQPLPPHFIEDESGTIRVNGMKIEDEGVYVCTLENTYGRKEMTARLSVSGLLPPLIAAPPNPLIEVVSPESVTLPCTVVMATPFPTITWYFKGEPVELTEGMFVTRDGDLRIPFADGRHEGHYECVATNVAGNSSLKLYLNILEPPMIREGRLQEETKVTEGNRVRLKCPVRGDPRPTYSWQKNGQPVMPFQRRLRVVSDGTLIIKGARAIDAGIYVCTAVNAAGATNTAVTLNVLVPPFIENDPSTFTVVEGEEVEVPCRARGLPLPSVTWSRPENEALNFSSTTMIDGSLRIYGSPHMEGSYECVVTNEAGSARKLVTVIVNKAPEIYPDGDEKLSVVEGEDIKLPCEVQGHPKPDVMWTRNGKEIFSTDAVRLFNNYMLLKNVSPDRRGEYTCRAENRAGIDSKTIHLDVEYPPYVDTRVAENRDRDFIEGSSFALPCPATGNPPPHRFWTKNGDKVQLGSRVFLGLDGTLEIEGARREHSGIYECTLTNSLGLANITYYVNIMVPPKVSQKEEKERTKVVEGEDINIRCPVDAFPIPSIEWLKDGVNIFSTKDRADVTHIIIEDNGQTLHIFEATLDDQGIYRCIVRNSAGETSLEFPLKVLVPPQFTTFLHDPLIVTKEGEELLLDCTVFGEPKPDITWERNGFQLPTLFPQLSLDKRKLRIAKVTQSDAGLYTCTATNDAGAAARNFSVTVYAAPMIDSLPGRESKQEIIAVMGQDTRVQCKVSGSPFPTVTWSFGDTPVEKVLGLQFTLQENNQVLTLNSVSPQHSGTYVCNATNNVGSEVKEFNVSVFMPPYIGGAADYVTEVEDVKAVSEATLRLSCQGGGFPPPQYSWFWENRPLTPTMMSYQIDRHDLVLNRVRVDSSGTYTCLAVNPAGSAEKHFKVQIQVPAQIGSETADSRRLFQRAPIVQEAVVDSSFTLYCPAFGIPEPSVIWSKDGNPLDILWQKVSLSNTSTTNVTNEEGLSSEDKSLSFKKTTWIGRFRSSEGGKRLTVDSAAADDSGTYTCLAQNPAGSDSIDMNVSVLAPPKVMEFTSSPVMIAESLPLELNCAFRGIPKPEATWLFNGADLKTLPIKGVDINRKEEGEVSIRIERVGREHIGVYTCLVTSVAGSDEITYDVTVATAPEVDKSLAGGPYPVISKANRPVTFECRVDSYPPPEFQWLRNGLPIDPLDKRYHIGIQRSTLQVLKVAPEDSGNYTCVASNAAGSANLDFLLEVHVPPHIEEDIIEDITSEEGKSVELLCPVVATPPPSILWMKGSEIIANSLISRNPEHLFIRNISRSDQGRYTCLATNEAGTLEQAFTIDVLVPPKLEGSNKATLGENVIINRQVTISCFIISDPSLSIEWSKDGVPLLLPKSGITVDTSGRRLTIAQTRPEDAGNYTCTAANAAGEINITTSLRVFVPPSWSKNTSESEEVTGIHGTDMTLNCDVDGNPTPSIIWLKDGQLIQNHSQGLHQDNLGRNLTIAVPDENTEGLYSCIASNAAGTVERNIRVSIHRPPYLTQLQKKNFQVLRNRPSRFECPVRGKPDPEIYWVVDGEVIDEASKFVQLSQRKRELHILRVMGKGNITVTCMANNSIGKLETDFNLEVLSPPIILHQPSVPEVYVVEGQKLVLQCNVSGYPTPKVFWTTGKGTLLLSEEVYSRGIKIENSGQQLSFPEILSEHEGEYVCAASNIGGYEEFTFTVKVNLPPVIEEPREGFNIVAEQGSPVMLECAADARPRPIIKWYKDGERLLSSQDLFLYLTDGDQRLRFLRVLDRHKGVYKCVADNEAGHDEREFTLQVLLPPAIRKSSDPHIEAEVGDTFDLKCEVEGNPVPQIKWKKGEIILIPSARREFSPDGQVLKVSNASSSDAGDYICSASSAVGTDESHFHVEIHSSPVILETAPSDYRPVLGRPHVLRCEAEGTPTPIISWTRSGLAITRFSDPNFQIKDDGKELHIARVRQIDGGYYTCVAASLSGHDSRTFGLTVVVPPVIESANQPNLVTGVAGKWAELICEASGSPNPDIFWRKYGELVSTDDDERYQLFGGGKNLRISQLTLEDSGVYTCEAENEVGADERNLTLQVIVPPTVRETADKLVRTKEGSNIALHCPVEAFPEPSVAWYADLMPLNEEMKGNMEISDAGKTLKLVRVSREDAATYVCTASNAAGTAQLSIDLQVGVPPLIIGGRETGSEEELLKVIDGGHVTFECPILQGQPSPSRSWLQGPNLLAVNHTVVGGGDSMIISKASVSHSGTYQCVAHNEYGVSVKLFRLVVQTAPTVNISKLIENGMTIEEPTSPPLPPDGRPRQTTLKTSAIAIEGTTFTLSCPVEGIPNPRLLWYRGNHPLLPSPRIIQNPSESSITINNVMTNDGGQYACVGVNPSGEIEISVSLIVEGQPMIHGDPLEEVPTVSGQPVIMECRIVFASTRAAPRGPPRQQPVDISWTKDGRLVSEIIQQNYDVKDNKEQLDNNSLSATSEYNSTLRESLNISSDSNDSNIIYEEVSAPHYVLSRDSTRLTIPKATSEDEGTYSCSVSNRAGRATKSFNVNILTPPSIDTLEEIRTFEAAVGEPVVFECNASGQPPPEVTWYKGENPLNPSSRHQFLESSHVLIIQSVQEEDGGQYTCYASNAAGTSVELFTLTVLVPPRLDGPVEERIEVISGRPIKMECPMEGNPTPEITWSFGSDVLSSTDEFVRRVGNDLVIDRVTSDWAGEYVCDGTNAVGRTFKIIHLLLKEAPLISGNPHTELETVTQGDAATLHCLASGQPLPTLHWEKDGVGIRLDHRVSISWGGRTLLIQNVNMEDAGRYTCTASNSAGNDTRQYRLGVLQPPRIEEGPNEVVAIEGEVITVFCSISGTPIPKITWYHNGEKIMAELKQHEATINETQNDHSEDLSKNVTMPEASRGILGSGALQFSPVLLAHLGNYTCAADNEAGRATHSFPVSVLSPPVVSLEISRAVATTGESVEFFCRIEGSLPVALSWKKGHMPLRPGPEFQIGANGTLKIPRVTLDMADTYTCLAKNPAGADEASEMLLVHELPRVKAITKETVLAAGQEAELECDISGQPIPSVTWSMPDRGGKEITPEDSRIQIWGNRLVIYPVVNEDMGTYRCTGTNRAGSDHANLVLVVTSAPTILEPLEEELNVVLGETVNLSCTPTSGYPPPSVIWRKEGRLVKSSARTHLATNGEIVIENVKAEDSGMYSCLVVNAAGRLYRVVTLIVEVPPRITLLPRTQEVTRGDSFSLECEAVGVPAPKITWLLNGTEVEGTLPSIGGRGRLDIENAAKSDEGTYTCLAKNTAGHRKAVAGIRVKVPPVIMHSPGEMTVQELSSVMLTCVAEGDPYPAVTWTKEGHYIASSDRVHLMNNGSLVIDSSKYSDSGKYKCVVSNDAGAAEAVSHLRVTMPPKIIKEPLSQDVEVGDTTIFNCEAEGEPRPQTQWSMAHKDLNERFKTLTNGSLQLVAVQVEDEGQVICQVFNELGEDLAKANISVRVPGMWGDWGPWSTCSSSCGPGKQIRQRRCDSPAPRNGGKPCQGDDISSRPCRLQACPVDGAWSFWDTWSECSVSCGKGMKIRKRLCNNPEPLYGGKDCEGSDTEEEPCSVRECPVDGSWSNWSPWTDCSRTCGEAFRQRSRICNNPPPSAGGADCSGDGLELMPCDGEPCQIDGKWSSWNEWSTCSQSCGKSTRYRERKCDNPAPANGGNPCEGVPLLEEDCSVQPCVIHGGWSTWSVWGPCSTTCGRGHRQRHRLCNNPEPQEGGQICWGASAESQPCTAPPCPGTLVRTWSNERYPDSIVYEIPCGGCDQVCMLERPTGGWSTGKACTRLTGVHGNWGSWSEWSSCSKTCGQGVRQRTRRCNNPYPRHGGDTCQGSLMETITCEDLSCRDLPLRAYGTLRGWLNGHDLGVISLAGNITTNGNQRTLVMSLSPLLPQYATWLTPLVSVVSSAFWSSAYEADGALNGNSLAKSTFTRESHADFESGEKVSISQTARGVDESGTLRFNVEVDGDVPYLQPGSFVTVQPFSEEYIQTGDGSLYVKSKRTFAVNGYHHPYTWNETVDYDSSSDAMPTLRQTLHANSVSASYRCLAAGEGSNTRGELSVMISSVIMPSSEGKTCPEGFTLKDNGNRTSVCEDNDECLLGETECSHFCKNIVGGHFCDCPPGFSIGTDGKTCEDIDECLSNLQPCGPREECTNSPGSFSCTYSCRAGFQKTHSGTACEDVDECLEETPCEQLCQNLLGSYQCDCFRGYTLETSGRCVDINECELYGSSCSHECMNVPGSFRCTCPTGFMLLNNGRCKDDDECSTFQHNCTDDEECQNYEGGFKCITQCPSGLKKANNGSCIDIDECAELSAGCHYTQRCQNMWGNYRCSCQRGYKSMGPGHPCIDINECQGSPPPCAYKCRNLMGDYECICPHGMRRHIDKKTCIALQYSEEPDLGLIRNPRPYLRQLPTLPGYPTREYQHRLLRRVYRVTKCPEGFSSEGDDCIDLNECLKPGRCQHACQNTNGSYQCVCPPGYRLRENQHSCEDINECSEEGYECSEDQMCINFLGTFGCVEIECPAGYQKVKGAERNCFLDCGKPNSSYVCPPGVKGSHRVVYKWASVSSGALAFQDLVRLTAMDEKGYDLPHAHFEITESDPSSSFRIRQENGEGVLSTVKNLEPGEEYRLTVEATSTDANQHYINYSTKFLIILHVSEYPY